MLTNHRIKLLDLHFLRHVTFVFCSSVKVSGTCRRLQFDLISHADSPVSP